MKKEEGDLGKAVQMMSELDKSGRKALTKLMGAEAVGDDLKVTEVSKEDAEKLLKPTLEKAQTLPQGTPGARLRAAASAKRCTGTRRTRCAPCWRRRAPRASTPSRCTGGR